VHARMDFMTMELVATVSPVITLVLHVQEAQIRYVCCVRVEPLIELQLILQEFVLVYLVSIIMEYRHVLPVIKVVLRVMAPLKQNV
jgi:hypothetical protein